MSYLSIGLLTSVLTLVALFRFAGRAATSKSVPRSGGVAMALAIGVSGLLAAVIPIGSSHVPAAGLLPALAGGFLIFLIGRIDDLRPLPPIVKLVGQIGAATLSYSLGLRAGFIPEGPWNQVFTVFCLVGGANALNLIDGVDGLAAGIAAIAAATLFFIARDLGNVNAAVLAVSLTGGALAFSWFNLPPARVYMGDAGSNLLGFGLAAVPLLLSWSPDGFANFSVAILLLAVPIVDTATTIIRRLALGRSPLVGDHDHIHHRLLRRGWPVGAVLLFFHGITLLIAVAIRFGESILSISVDRTLVAWLALSSLLILSAVFNLSAAKPSAGPKLNDESEF